MYSNPKALWRTIAGFIERVEGKLHAWSKPFHKLEEISHRMPVQCP
jgi:hypothetical protein